MNSGMISETSGGSPPPLGAATPLDTVLLARVLALRAVAKHLFAQGGAAEETGQQCSILFPKEGDDFSWVEGFFLLQEDVARRRGT